LSIFCQYIVSCSIFYYVSFLKICYFYLCLFLYYLFLLLFFIRIIIYNKLKRINTYVYPLYFYISKSVSRILSRIVIYLVHILLYGSSHQIKKMPSRLSLLVSVLLQMGFTQTQYVTILAVSSYLTFSPLPFQAVIFCCTFLKVSLTGRYPASLLYGVRTFLVCNLSVFAVRDYLIYS